MAPLPGFTRIPSLLRRLFFPLWMTILLLFSAWMRLRDLDGFRIHFDSIRPFYDAIMVRDGESWRIHDAGYTFVFGYLQTILLLPIVSLSSTLRQALALGALLHSLVVLPVGLAVRRVSGAWAGGVAASWVAVNPLLVDHPHYGGYCFQAPMMVALGGWMAVLSTQNPGLWPLMGLSLSLSGAILLHPFGGTALLGLLPWVPFLLSGQNRRSALVAAGAGLLALLPMIHANLRLLWAGGSGLTTGFARGIPTGKSQEPLWETLLTSFNCAVGGNEWGWRMVVGMTAVLIAAGLSDRDRGVRFLARWSGSCLLVLFVMGGALGHLRDYHVSVFFPLVAMAAVSSGASLVKRGVSSLRIPRESRGHHPWLILAVVGLGGGMFSLFPAAAVTSCSSSLRDPRISSQRLDVTEQGLREVLLLSRASPLSVAVMAADLPTGLSLRGAIPRTTALVHPVALALAGVSPSRLPIRVLPGEPLPRPVLVAEMTDPLWEQRRAVLPGELTWAPEVLLAFPTQPSTTLRVLTWKGIGEARRWLTRFCGGGQSSAFIDIDGPMDPVTEGRARPPLDPYLTHWPAACAASGSPSVPPTFQ